MPKPTQVYDWDTNGTNIVPTTSGHKSDGYANNEIPTAGEWNYLHMAHAFWLAYFEAVTDDLLARRYLTEESHTIGPSKFLPTVAANATWAGGDWSGTSGVGFGLQAVVDFVPVGGTITKVRFSYNRAGAGTVTRSLFRAPVDAPGSPETVYTSDDTTTTGYQDFEATLGTPHVVEAGYHYSLVISVNGASDTAGGKAFTGGVTWF